MAVRDFFKRSPKNPVPYMAAVGAIILLPSIGYAIYDGLRKDKDAYSRPYEARQEDRENKLELLADEHETK